MKSYSYSSSLIRLFATIIGIANSLEYVHYYLKYYSESYLLHRSPLITIKNKPILEFHYDIREYASTPYVGIPRISLRHSTKHWHTRANDFTPNFAQPNLREHAEGCIKVRSLYLK